jgi:hypothetical protein
MIADQSLVPGEGTPGMYASMTLTRGVSHAPDDDTRDIIRKLLFRINSVKLEHEIFRQWCDRADGLYYANVVGKSGADLWPDHESATINGRQHISANTPSAYIDIPVALQAVEPIEDVLPTDTTDEARTAAASEERAYVAWKQEENFELKWHKAITTKSLYGRTAARVYWDEDEERACAEIIHQPQHLWLGWKTDAYEELEWAAYRTFWEPNALTEEYGVEVIAFKDPTDGVTVPFVQQRAWDEAPARPWVAMGDVRVEVWDYWYRQPVWKGSKFVRMDTYNVVVAGNIVLRGPLLYKEYKGRLPYVPLFNTFVPGIPNGRPDLYDIEPLIREKMERLTNGSQMIANVTGGDAFQLTGPDAPTRVPSGLKPIRNGIVAPGPGNRIETITPFIAQFQLEQFLGRIDREMAVISGLNDLLLGLAPAQVLSSSKAINALIANYESRLSMRRKMLYVWRRDVWKLARTVMVERMKGEAGDGLRAMAKAGFGFLEITDPSLSPRDDMETMTRALNAVNGKLWSQRTAMNIVGIDDPETEQDLIREERTDATMFPADVQVMAQLLGALQSLGLQAPQGVQQQAQGQLTSGTEGLRQALGAQTPQNAQSSQLPGDQGVTPTIPGAAPQAGGETPLVAPPDNQPVLQGMVKNGEAGSRLLTQQKLGRR